MDKLFLLDAYALIYRAYYAFIKSPRINSKGFNTSAVLGFVNTLEDVLKKETPTHIGVAFDPAGPTFRHEAYEQYKAQREETPEAIRLSVPIIKDIIRAYRIPILEVPGYEADDVIGTLATEAGRRGITTYMMTPDKDYGQLVSDNVFMYRPKYGDKEFEVMGIEQIKAKFDIQSPAQVIDMLGLMGDSSDNIPGCPGVGEKTAQKLIAQYGSIENLLSHTDELKGALKTKVAQHQNDMPSEYATLEANYADLSIKLNKDLNKAKDYLQKAKAYFQSTKVAISIYYIMTMELELALKQNDLQTAASLVQQISHDSTVNVPINYQQRRNDVLTEYYKRTGNYSKALAILAAQLPIEDSIRSEEHNNYVAELDLRYKNDTTPILKDNLPMGTAYVARFDFSTKKDEQIIVSTAISGVSMEGAAKNLQAEVPENDFEKYRLLAKETWNKELSKIKVESENKDDKTVFYTALYHSMLAPTIYSDVDGQYYGPDHCPVEVTVEI